MCLQVALIQKDHLHLASMNRQWGRVWQNNIIWTKQKSRDKTSELERTDSLRIQPPNILLCRVLESADRWWFLVSALGSRWPS